MIVSYDFYHSTGLGRYRNTRRPSLLVTSRNQPPGQNIQDKQQAKGRPPVHDQRKLANSAAPEDDDADGDPRAPDWGAPLDGCMPAHRSEREPSHDAEPPKDLANIITREPDRTPHGHHSPDDGDEREVERDAGVTLRQLRLVEFVQCPILLYSHQLKYDENTVG